MKRWLPVILLLLALLGVWWFWSLGSVPDSQGSSARLRAVEGSVTIRGEGGAERSAQAGMELVEGEIVMTGADGKATIDWFGQGETRIGEATELQIARASHHQSVLQVRMRLAAGRVWTRVQRLLDIEAEVAVETADVVSTVRGTSFDVQKSVGLPTTIWVADSVVEAAGATVGGPADGFFIPEGSMADFHSGERTTSTRLIGDADRATAWFTRNREADARFQQEGLERWKNELGGQIPMGLMRDLTRWSEGLRLRFAASERRAQLESRYILRRLLEVRLMAEEGKSGLAYQEFARLDGELRAKFSAEEGSSGALRVAVLSAQSLYRDVPPSSAAYRIKQQLEEWLGLVSDTSAKRLFARLMVIDARLDEASNALATTEQETATQVLVLARQGLVNADRERKEASDLSREHQEKIARAWKALSIRADALDRQLRALNEPRPSPPIDPVVSPTSTVDLVVTSTPTVIETSVATTSLATTTVPVVTPKPVSLTITPQNMTIGFFERVTYRAIVVYDSGLTRDVTKASRFTASPQGYGALNGNVFSATQLQGSITIRAEYVEDGVGLTADAALTMISK